jgi:multicomponent Na+:H+ antiporter subunit A
MKSYPNRTSLFSWLGVFMAAMLGLVLADDWISLFVFWEMTSVSSFFLIGFHRNDKESRKAAVQALVVTGIGGLLLLVAGVIIGTMSGTYVISELGARLKVHSLYPLMALLIMGAAFTKSAQFPFHFWLPGAMKAPTPVSTYLHSATMVKAGIYLLLRTTDSFGGTELWNGTLTAVGLTTLVYAAWQSLMRTDLKALLAYTTTAALGTLVMLIGLGTPTAIAAALVFIGVHALYKAALFLVAGAVDKSTGIRDVTRLGGLRKTLPWLALAAGVAGLSNAGIPGFFGYISKDLVYEATMKFGPAGQWMIFLIVAANICIAWAGYQVGIRPFWSKAKSSETESKSISVYLWGPPLLLVVPTIFYGFLPGASEALLSFSGVRAVLPEGFGTVLKIWHGITTELFFSISTIIGGVVLYVLLKPGGRLALWWGRWEAISPGAIAGKTATGLKWLMNFLTGLTQNGFLRQYLFVILMFSGVVIGLAILTGDHYYPEPGRMTAITIYEAAILMIMAMSVGLVVFTRSRLAAVAGLGVVGYAMCLLFVFYSAPDLAMTQFAIDTLTVILFVLVIYKLPKYKTFSILRERIRDGFVALSLGLLITLLSLEVLNEPLKTETGDYYAQNSYLLAKGKNVVNVILVDFRGADTLVEITVLAVAALGVYGLLKLRIHSSGQRS